MQQDDRIFAIVGACVVTAAAVIAGLVFLGTGITVDAPQRAAVVVQPLETPTPAAATASAANDGDLAPQEGGEDDAVRRAVAHLSAHPRFAALLVNDRLLVRFVTAVDAVAGGYSPRDQMEFLRPQRPFLVRESEGRLVTAAGSHHRYDLAVEIIDSIDIAGAVELYRRFEPRLEEIYEDIGWAGEDFDSRLREAVDHLLDVEGLGGPFELEQRAIVYAYADEHLEQLSDAQKQLLRMGPANTRRLVAKLHDLREAMGWPARVLEEPDTGVLDAGMDPDNPIVTAATSPMWSADDVDDRTGAYPAP